MTRAQQVALARHRRRVDLRQLDDIILGKQPAPPSRGGALPHQDLPKGLPPHLAALFDDEPDYDCAEGRHDPFAIRASSSPEPLGYFCRTCRVTCDANGRG